MSSVLVVDDSLYTRRILCKVLQSCGFEDVLEASSADEAVQMYWQFKPTVVIMDIVMPGHSKTENGLEALKRIMTHDPDAKIVVCSALDQFALKEHALSLGAKGFITKPFDPENLLKAVLSASDESEHDTDNQHSRQY